MLQNIAIYTLMSELIPSQNTQVWSLQAFYMVNRVLVHRVQMVLVENHNQMKKVRCRTQNVENFTDS